MLRNFRIIQVLLIITLLLLIFSCHEYTNPVDPYNGLVAYYTFDGNAENSVDGFNNGTMSDGVTVTADRNGNAGGALEFDGEDTYVQVPDSNALRIQDELTLSAWVYLNSRDWDYARIVTKEYGYSRPYVSYGLMADHDGSGRFGFHMCNEDDDIIYIQADETHSTNQWYHVAGVWNGTIMKLYIDGQQQQETAEFTDDIAYPGILNFTEAYLNMGGDTAREIEYLDGAIDEVRVYSRALTAAEIASIYNGMDPIIQLNPEEPYSTSGGDDRVYNADICSDGGTILTGYTSSYGSGHTDGLLVKFDSSGKLEWQKCYGQEYYEYLYYVAATSYSDIYLAGETNSSGAGYYDYWIIKMSSQGAIHWEKTIGTSYSEGALSVSPTSDGGCIATGTDLWVVKLNASGNLDWNTSYATSVSGTYRGRQIEQLSDGSFIICGYIPSSYNDYESCLMKIDSDGNIIWSRSFGGIDTDLSWCFDILTDGSIIVGNETYSYGAGDKDIWLTKFSSDGTISWQKTYGTADTDGIRGITVTSDGGFIIGGYSYGFSTTADPWIFKTDSNGNIEWQKTYEGYYNSSFYSPLELSDGQFSVCGYAIDTSKDDADVIRMEISADGSGSPLTNTNITAANTSATVSENVLNEYTLTATINTPSSTTTTTALTVTEITQ